MITLADIQAFEDVVRQLQTEIDEIPGEQAILMLDQLARTKKEVELAHSLCRTRALNAMDGQPIKVGDSIYFSKPDGKWRPNHVRIRSVIAEAAVHDDDGVMIREVGTAVARAIGLIYDLFVSPAMVPKETGLKRLKVDLRDVSTWERGLPQIKKADAGGPEE